MDPMNTNQNPIASGNQFPPPEPPRSSMGPIAGTVIVIILLIAGGLYFWGAKINNQMNNDVPYIPNDNSMMQDEQPVGELQSDTSAGLPPQSSSDDVSSIEADLNAMDMSSLESENSVELNNI
ncbi:MAG: hypothetical protein AAB605_02425 [Patescibacteria group bacterium]